MLVLTPEQMRRRWFALGIVATAFILSFFQRFAPAGIAQDLSAAFNTTATSLGVLAASYFYVYTVMQVPTGILADTLGPRRVLAIGGIVGGIGSFMFGMAPTLEWALIGRTLIGLGVSVTFIAMLKLIAVWFEENRFATLVGVCMLIGNMGSVLAGAPLSAMAQSSGWRGVFIGVGVLSLILAVACWFVVRDRVDEGKDAPKARFDRTVVIAGLLSVVRNRATWPAALLNTGMAGVFFTFAGLWAVPYLMQVHGMVRSDAATHLSLWFASFAVSSLIIGTLSDQIRRRKPVVIICSNLLFGLMLLLYSGMALPGGLSYLVFGLLGLSTAGFALSWACAKEVNPPLLSGMSTSVANMGGFLAGALLQPLFGWVMDLGWQGEMLNGARFYDLAAWRSGLLVVLASALLGAIAAWRIRETGCRNIWQELDPGISRR
jgi:MFS family permease